MKRLAIIIALFCQAALAVPTTYYIDCASGSDSNNGTAKGTPWAHAPGMTGTVAGVGPGAIDTANGVGGICGSVCSLPGDEFIFKGGVTCGSGNFPWTMRQSGTGSVIGTSAVYFGVDQTWFTGGSWTRPIFDLGGAAANLCGNTTTPANSGSCFNGFGAWTWAPTGFIIADNFEWTNLYWYASGVTNGQETYINYARCNSSGHCEIKNMYMHGWAHHAYSAGANADVCNLLAGDTSIVDRTTIAHDNVIDGSDTAQDACVVFWGGPPFAYNNYVHGVPNGAVVDSVISFHDNWFDTITTSYDTSQHQNTFEDNGSNNAEFFYNNLVTNTTNSNGLTLNFAPCTGTTTYVFNNVLGNTDDTPLNVQPECGTGTLFVFNNTIELGADSTPGSGNSGTGTGTFPGCPTGLAGCTYRNNHFIGTQSSGTCQAACTLTTNLSQTIAVAKQNTSTHFDQYSFSESPYKFAPLASTNSTVSAGTANASLCTTITGLNAAAGAACSNDTTYGIIYNATPHTVSSPGRTANVRAATPDIGGFQFSGGPTTPVFSPNGGTFTTNPSVTITCGSGATCCYTTNGGTPTAGTPGTCDQSTYSTPVSIPSTLTLKAIGTEVGFTNSSVASALFTMIPLIAPGTLAFGNQTVNTTSAGQVETFTNNTGATITFTSVALTTGTQFAISANTCTGTLTNTSSCTTTITFTPTTAGAKSDTLTYTDSDASSPQTVSLSGTGVAGGGGNAVTLTRGVTMTQGTTVVQ